MPVSRGEAQMAAHSTPTLFSVGLASRTQPVPASQMLPQSLLRTWLLSSGKRLKRLRHPLLQALCSRRQQFLQFSLQQHPMATKRFPKTPDRELYLMYLLRLRTDGRLLVVLSVLVMASTPSLHRPSRLSTWSQCEPILQQGTARIW